jgi:hypothetical protein
MRFAGRPLAARRVSLAHLALFALLPAMIAGPIVATAAQNAVVYLSAPDRGQRIEAPSVC